MVFATLMFTIMVATVKVARQELSAFEVIAWRSVIAVPITFALAHRSGVGIGIRNRRGMALRGGLGFAAMTCFFTAAKGLPLAELSIIVKLQPILIALVAPLALGRSERSGPMIWMVLVLGLAGCGLLIGPELSVGGTFGLWALGAAVFSALAHTTIRALGKTDHPLAIVFWFQVITLVLAVPGYALTEGGALPLPPSHLWPYLAGTGIAATAGQVLMTNAYRLEKASIVAAASYAAPLWAAALDMAVFGLAPSGTAVLGGTLVVGAGLLLVLRGGPREEPAAELDEGSEAQVEAAAPAAPVIETKSHPM